MTIYEEIYLISALIKNADSKGHLDLNNKEVWQELLLTEETGLHEDLLLNLNDKKILYYEEVGEDGFAPIRICSVYPSTKDYLKELLNTAHSNEAELKLEITRLNNRITEILTFDPNKLSAEIKSTEAIIEKTKREIESNPILASLETPLRQIDMHFKSLSKVAHSYEDVYKNIILPVREEGKSGIRQTVRWAIISIIVSTLLSFFLSWLSK